MDLDTVVAAPSADAAPAPEASTVPASDSQSDAADMAAALKAFRSATGAPESPEVAPEPAKAPEAAPKAAAAPEAPQAPEKASADLTAILARMQRFEDERAESARVQADLKAKLEAAEQQLTVKDPIEFLKRKGFSREQIEDYLLNGEKSEVAQKSKMDQLEERLARFEASDSERGQRSAAEQAEAKRSAAEAHYKANTLSKVLDAAKYPLLHQAHTPDEIVNMAYARAVNHFKRTNGQEPEPADVFGEMETQLTTLRDKLIPAAKPAARGNAPALSELASHNEAGSGGTEPEDDAAALKAASALAAQFMSGKR